MTSNYEFVGGQRMFAGVPLATLAERFGTPLYVYDAAAVEAAFKGYETAFGTRPHRVCYAVKANHNPDLLRLLVACGAGFDIVSAGELEMVLAAGAAPESVVFSGVGKRRDELERAVAAGIGCFNVESPTELELLAEVAGERGTRAAVAIRVNPDVDPQTHPYIATGLSENKFGVAMDEATALYRRAAALDAIEIAGVACHIGSQLLELGPIADAVERVAALVVSLEEEGIALGHIDVGGGLGVDYEGETPPSPAELVRRILPLVPPELEVKVEPGRSIVAPAGALLTRVLIVKRNASRTFVIVDAAMNDLMRPSLYGAVHRIRNAAQTSVAIEPCDVVGPVCETGDFLGRGVPLAAAEGDLLVVSEAGAYGYVMASNYNARGKPAEVWIADGEARLSRRREGTDALFALDEAAPGTHKNGA